MGYAKGRFHEKSWEVIWTKSKRTAIFFRDTFPSFEVHVETLFLLIINQFHFGTLRRGKKMIMMNIEDNSRNVLYA